MAMPACRMSCAAEALRNLYHPPVKRSIAIAGHKTSISLEPLFWDLLRAAADAEAIPINALVARIDAERLLAETTPGLASAIRLWLADGLVSWLAGGGRGATSKSSV